MKAQRYSAMDLESNSLGMQVTADKVHEDDEDDSYSDDQGILVDGQYPIRSFEDVWLNSDHGAAGQDGEESEWCKAIVCDCSPATA